MPDSKERLLESNTHPEVGLRWFEEVLSEDERVHKEYKEIKNENIIERIDHETDSEIEVMRNASSSKS